LVLCYIVGIGDISTAELNLLIGSAFGLTGMAVGGYSSGDATTGVAATINNLDFSNTFQFINIDDTEGNIPGGFKLNVM